jgi:hypothetical protein
MKPFDRSKVINANESSKTIPDNVTDLESDSDVSSTSSPGDTGPMLRYDEEDSDSFSYGDSGLATVKSKIPTQKSGSFLSMFLKSDWKLAIDDKPLEIKLDSQELEENVVTEATNYATELYQDSNMETEAIIVEDISTEVKSVTSLDKMQNGVFLNFFFKQKAPREQDSTENTTVDQIGVHNNTEAATASPQAAFKVNDDSVVACEDERALLHTDTTVLPRMKQSLTGDTNEQRPGLLAILFQRKGVEQSSAVTPGEAPSVGAPSFDANDDSAPDLAPINLEAPNNQSKPASNDRKRSELAFLFDLFQRKGTSVEEKGEEEDNSNAGHIERYSEASDEASLEQPKQPKRRSSTFIAMFFDASPSPDDNRPNEDRLQAAIESESKETLEAEQPRGAQEKDLNETIHGVKFKMEDKGFDNGFMNVSLPIEDPYLDDNAKSQKEQMCCSFLFR